MESSVVLVMLAKLKYLQNKIKRKLDFISENVNEEELFVRSETENEEELLEDSIRVQNEKEEKEDSENGNEEELFADSEKEELLLGD